MCLKKTELSNLKTIARQSAFERLQLEKHIAENNVQTVSVFRIEIFFATMRLKTTC